MSEPQSLLAMALGLLGKWETFVSKARKQDNFDALEDYERGFVAGFEAAEAELRTLIAQVHGLPLTNPAEEPSLTTEGAEWEYLYIRFEQTEERVWRLNEVNGIRQLQWETAPSFEEAIRRLRDEHGWRLTTFAKGLHVFRRPH